VLNSPTVTVQAHGGTAVSASSYSSVGQSAGYVTAELSEAELLAHIADAQMLWLDAYRSFQRTGIEQDRVEAVAHLGSKNAALRLWNERRV